MACTPRHVPEPGPLPVPAPEVLFAHHLAAIGGAEAVAAHRSQHITGTVYVEAQDISAPFDIRAAAPADVVAITHFPGDLSLESGVVGEVAWARDPGARWRLGDERTAAIRRAALHRDIHYDDGVGQMRASGPEDFHGQGAWRVDLDFTQGPDEAAWFSVADGVLIGRTEWGDSQAPPEEVLFENPRAFGGVLMPTRQTRWMDSLVMVSEIETVVINEPTDIAVPDDLAPPSGPPVVLPLQRRGAHIVVPVTMGGQVWAFLLDTGANATVLDSGVAAQLALTADGLEVPAGGAGGEIDGLRLRRAVPMTIGERDYPAPMVAILDLSGLGLAGVLGADFLAWHTIDIDPAAGELRLTDVLPDLTGLTPIEVQRFSAGLLRLSATVAGQPVPAMLDLGADVSVLSWRAANLAGLSYGDGERDGDLIGADGRSVSLYAAEIPLSLGDIALGKPRVCIANLDALRRHFGDGPTALIGQDLLLGRRLVIDYSGEMIYLEGTSGIPDGLIR